MRAFAMACLMGTWGFGAVHAQTYTVTDLGVIHSPPVMGHDINDSREVCGVDGARPFAWSQSVSSTLPALEAGLPAGEAHAINAAGTIAGWSEAQQGLGVGRRAVLWGQGGVVDLGTLRVSTTPIFGDFDMAHDINDLGVVVGEADTDFLPHAFRWESGDMLDLGALGPNALSVAYGINDQGQVVGASTQNSIADWVAVRWASGVMTSLGYLPGQQESRALALNSAGVAVGYSSSNNGGFENKYATLWGADDAMVDLRPLLPSGQSWVNDINDQGWMVGRMGVPEDSHAGGQAFVYDADGCGLVDLNSYLPGSGTLFTNLIEALGINENGDIVGHGVMGDGTTHAFLLTRNVQGVGAVDEPCGGTTEVTLVAGQWYDAGIVSVANDGDTLCVHYSATGGQCMTETHLEIALTVDDVPQTGSGNPKVGKFTYGTQHTPPVSEATYCVSLAALGYESGAEIVIAAHAAMCGGQTAWGAGDGFAGSSWAMYFNHTIGECCPAGVPASSSQRTATQGAWGADCPEHDAACQLASSFDDLFPAGLTVGTVHHVTLTSAAAVRDLLPTAGSPAALSASYTDPFVLLSEDPDAQATEAGAFLGNVTSLVLNLAFDESIPGFGHPAVRLRDFRVASGPAAGRTVMDVADEANRLLGGEPGTFSMSVTAVNELVRAINDCFFDATSPGTVLQAP